VCVCVCIYIYNHVDFKYVCLQIVLWKQRKENLQDIILVQMYETVKIQMHFRSIYLIFFLTIFL